MTSATSGVSVLCTDLSIQVAICFRQPFELWSLIFDYVFADLRDAFQDFVHSRAITSQVCVVWRTITTGTSSLWSRLDIGTATSSDWVSVVLARCGNLPISVRLDIPSKRWRFSLTVKSSPSILCLLRPYCDRMESFSVTLVDNSSFAGLKQLIMGT
ncbi:hypothetical protein C8J57DRAFT_1371276 [Mycena rebaudengoi]|nr:hypothetical protein C8J57DRAFT_1371276 [Mycena rebaudengoi]